MTPRRLRILERYVLTGSAKGHGIDESRVRRVVREACDEYGVAPTMLATVLCKPAARRTPRPATVPIWDGDIA